MVVYVLGDEGAKRAAFEGKNGPTEVYVDNLEVEGSVRRQKTLYVTTGKRPFDDMTVDGFVSYSRALMDDGKERGPEARAALSKVRLRAKSRKTLNRLSVFDYRKAILAGKLTEATKTVYANFGGLGFSRKNKAGLRAFARALKKFDLYLLVSDYRLIARRDEALIVGDTGVLSLAPPRRVKEVSSVKLQRMAAKPKRTKAAE